MRAGQVGANKIVWLELDVPLVECENRGARKQIKLEIADPMKRFARAFAEGRQPPP